MINVNELRIGNLFIVGGCIYKIELSTFILIKNNESYLNSLQPIELTEEWFVKLGFEKVNHIHGYSFFTLSNSKKNRCHIDIYKNKTQYMGYSVKHCNYLHELQDLFYTLTGRELEYK